MRYEWDYRNQSFSTYSNILQSPVEIETTGFGIVISVLFNSQTSVLGQRNVIAPCRCWHIQVFVSREKSRQERSTNTEGTSSWNSLHSSILQWKFSKAIVYNYKTSLLGRVKTDQSILSPFIVLSKGKVDGSFAEFWTTGNRWVLLVHVLLLDFLFSLNIITLIKLLEYNE